MANVLQGLFGGKAPAAPAGDADFADFASPADPSPAPLGGGFPSGFANPLATGQPVPFTAWYRIWERSTPGDFIAEAFIIPIIFTVILFSVWGRRTNKTKAKSWAVAHGPILEKEFAQVGFTRPRPSTEQSAKVDIVPEHVIEEKGPNEYISYATGRQNIAFVDIKLELLKRYSPLSVIAETAIAFFFPSYKAPAERMEAVIYPFDGREKDVIPVRSESEQAALEARVKDLTSSYDGFVWAVVNKDNMRSIRDDRYDISLTFTKDNAKLPDWATVMSESAEISDAILTPDLIKAITDVGEDRFEHLIVSDQPVDKPFTLNEAAPRKRLTLSLRLPSSSSESAYASSLPLFNYFIRLPDILASTAHYRPEVLRRIKATREDEIRKLKKVEEDEKAEERKQELDKKKKEERDRKLKSLSADEQRKFLDKEREKEQRKMGKKRTMKA